MHSGGVLGASGKTYEGLCRDKKEKEIRKVCMYLLQQDGLVF